MRKHYFILTTLSVIVLSACSSNNSNNSATEPVQITDNPSEPILISDIGKPTGSLDDDGDEVLFFPEPQLYDLSATDFDSNSATITNPYLMFFTNRVTVFEGQTEDAFERIVLEVLPETRMVNGVKSAIVVDTVYHDGEIVEKTFDWFAQDTLGRVWYMGEEVEDFADGVLISTAGSWEAGKDILNNGFIAEAGIQMFALPEVNSTYYQEYYLTEAEDAAVIVDVAAPVTLSDGTQYSAVKVLEWEAVAPTSFAYKYYAENVGLVLETNMDGEERIELISVTD